MLYESLEKIPATEYNRPDSEKNRILFKLVERISEEAEIANKTYIIGGGIALAIYYNKICRRHKDLDLYVDENDFDFWKGFFMGFGYGLRKNSWNDNYLIFNENKKIKRRVGDLNFRVPSTVETDDGKAVVVDNRTEEFGARTRFVPYLLVNNIKILPPEIVKEQKICRFLKEARPDNRKRDDVDFRVYFDIVGIKVEKDA